LFIHFTNAGRYGGWGGLIDLKNRNNQQKVSFVVEQFVVEKFIA
jgi:hypothetical protein